VAIDGWTVTFGTAMMGLGGAATRPGLSLYQMLPAHPPTVSVPTTVLLYNGPLLCGFNVPIKRLENAYS